MTVILSSSIQVFSMDESLKYDPMNPASRKQRQAELEDSGKKQLASAGDFKTKSPYTGTKYTHKARYSSYKIAHGVDVSYWNSKINWTKVKNDGISYAFLRSAYHSYSKSGGLYPDSTFERNYTEARKAGVKVGVYIFSQALTKKEAVAEANYVIKQLKGRKVDLPVIMDYEYAPGRFKSGKISKKTATANVNAFADTVKKAGYNPMLYGSTSFLHNQLNMSQITCKVWVAQYNWRNTYSGSYEYWQYSSSGKVSGISGSTDVNFRYYKPAAATTPTTARITWTKKADAEKYIISRYNEKTKEYEEIKTVTGPDTTSFTDKNLSPATVYYYRVESVKTGTVVNSDGSETQAEERKIITNKKAMVTLPEKATGLKAAKRSKTKIKLSWTRKRNATGYEVYRYSAKSRSYKLIKRTASTSYTDTSLTKGLAYRYKVRAYRKYSGKYYRGAFSKYLHTRTKGTYLKKMKAKGKVKISGLNARKGAGTEFSSVAKLRKKQKVTITGYSKDLYRNKWYRVKFKKGGKTRKAYVYASYVKEIK